MKLNVIGRWIYAASDEGTVYVAKQPVQGWILDRELEATDLRWVKYRRNLPAFLPEVEVQCVIEVEPDTSRGAVRG